MTSHGPISVTLLPGASWFFNSHFPDDPYRAMGQSLPYLNLKTNSKESGIDQWLYHGSYTQLLQLLKRGLSHHNSPIYLGNNLDMFTRAIPC